MNDTIANSTLTSLLRKAIVLTSNDEHKAILTNALNWCEMKIYDIGHSSDHIKRNAFLAKLLIDIPESTEDSIPLNTASIDTILDQICVRFRKSIENKSYNISRIRNIYNSIRLKIQYGLNCVTDDNPINIEHAPLHVLITIALYQIRLTGDDKYAKTIVGFKRYLELHSRTSDTGKCDEIIAKATSIPLVQSKITIDIADLDTILDQINKRFDAAYPKMEKMIGMFTCIKNMRNLESSSSSNTTVESNDDTIVHIRYLDGNNIKSVAVLKSIIDNKVIYPVTSYCPETIYMSTKILFPNGIPSNF